MYVSNFFKYSGETLASPNAQLLRLSDMIAQPQPGTAARVADDVSRYASGDPL